MKHFLLAFLLLITLASANASICYHGINEYSIIADSAKISLQIVVKDADRISMLSRNIYSVSGIPSLQGFEIVSDKGDFFLVKNNANYYAISKQLTYKQQEKGQLAAILLGKVQDIQDNKDAYWLKKKNRWYYLDLDEYNNKVHFVAIPAYISNFDIIHYYNKRYLIRAAKSVAVLEIIIDYKNNRAKFEVIPDLDPAQTVFYEGNYYTDNCFLMDNDTYYLIGGSSLYYKNRTHEFTSAGKQNGFNKLKLTRGSLGYMYFEDTDSIVWCHEIHGITVNNNSFSVDECNVYLFPIKALMVNQNIGILKHNGKYYNNGWNAIYKRNDIDVAKVVDIEGLYLSAAYYRDSVQYYIEDDKTIIPFKPEMPDFPPTAVYYSSVGLSSYAESTKGFYADGCFLYFMDAENKTVLKKQAYQSDIKCLTLAYAYDDKLLIENIEIDNIADCESMEFAGSIVHVIDPCSDKGTSPIEVRYRYYFKDKNAIYTYYSGDGALNRHAGELPALLIN